MNESLRTENWPAHRTGQQFHDFFAFVPLHFVGVLECCCDMTPSYATHCNTLHFDGVLECCCDMTPSYASNVIRLQARHESSFCAQCDMTPLNVGHVSFILHILLHGIFICGACLIYRWDIICMWHGSLICVMTHSCVTCIIFRWYTVHVHVRHTCCMPLRWCAEWTSYKYAHMQVTC